MRHTRCGCGLVSAAAAVVVVVGGATSLLVVVLEEDIVFDCSHYISLGVTVKAVRSKQVQTKEVEKQANQIQNPARALLL